MEQTKLAIRIAVAKEIDGLEMGVLEDSTPYLSGRSLARLCGTAVSTIINQADQWNAGKRDNKLARMIVAQGLERPSLYIPLGTANAYPDDICMAFLEYYAFEAQGANAVVALDNFRKLARASLRLFIYRSTGYDPQNRIPERWTKFHDRLMLNTTPAGYFSVFREMSDLVLTAIQNGLVVDARTIPDISVGQAWSKHWKDNGLEEEFGSTREHPHTYPDYFPQSVANAFIKAKIYPLAALGDFRVWMQTTYLPEKFPRYLDGKVQRGALPPSTAELILAAFDVSDEELAAAPGVAATLKA